MKRKTFLSLLLAAVMFLSLAPITALAAGTTNVWVDNTLLTDGENSVGDGTATLNKEAGTLTLENIQASKFVQVLTDDTFTVVVKGNVSIGSAAARTSGTALYSTAAALKIQIEQGAELSMYTENGNNVYVYGGSLTISGPGTLTADAIEGDSGAFPSLVATKDITLNGGLVAELVSEWHGAFSEKGNIVVDSADLTVYADSVGLFAQTYDEGANAEIPSSITLKDSHVAITSYYGDAAAFCGTGGLVVENSVLDLTADKDSEWGGYGLYSEGDIVIRGEKTEIDSDDAFGIEAGDTLYIEGGQVRLASTETALLGWNGVVITGGTIDATSEIGSAIIGRDGPVSITGAGTSVTATAKGDDAAIRNANDGGIFLAAPVTAVSYTHLDVYKRQDQHRAAVFENIFGKRAVVREHVPQSEAQALVDEEDIDADDHEFKQPRRQRRNGRALDAERGRAKIAEDQHPVEEYVCGERREVDHHRYFYNLDRAQAAYEGVAESEGKIGVAEYAQIFGAAFDHGRAVGVQAHDVLGEQQHGQSQNAAPNICARCV